MQVCKEFFELTVGETGLGRVHDVSAVLVEVAEEGGFEGGVGWRRGGRLCAATRGADFGGGGTEVAVGARGQG